MEQRNFPPRIQRYIMAYQMLLDALDEYREELAELKRPDCRKELGQEYWNRILMRCESEARQVFRLLPWREGRYRGFRLLGSLLRLLEWLCLFGALIGLGVFLTSWRPVWLVLALIGLTCNRICSRLTGLLRDTLVWRIAAEDYRPHETMWNEKQEQLLPQRLRPFVRPLHCSIDPDNCIRARVQCICGGQRFRVWRHPKEGYLKATCAECGREIVVFDEHLDARHADGQGQQYYSNALEMAVCRSCKHEIHRLVLMVASDERRTFFQSGPADGESGYCIWFQLFCAECGAPSGEGQYFWCRELEEQESVMR